ncbi:MAG: MBL fold metallo-hydrolase [Thermoplasmatota archaeon]
MGSTYQPRPAGRAVVAPRQIELPVPFPLKTVNAWLFQGQRPALVDCGLGSRRSYQALHDGLAETGQDPAKLSLHVTHGHVDHAGNAGRLRHDHGVPLAAPRVESPYIETFRRDSAERNDAFAYALARHGMPAEDVVRLRADSDAIDRYLDDVPITDDLPDGSRIQLGDQDVHTYHAPGHTPGSTIFVLEDNDVLTGDTLLERITSNAVELLDDDRGAFHRYVASVDALRRHAGCRALPGHHAPFEITEELIDRHLGWHEDRAQRIVAALERPRTAYELLPIIFPGLTQDGQLFMAMADLVGHLHALELDGRISSRDQEGIRRFTT